MQTGDFLFSIITPIYNGELYLENYLKAVLNQSYRNFQLILIDDGSQDRSVELISSFVDSRIDLIKKSNSGQAASTNLGIEYALGDFILFLDVDDELYSDCLERFADAIKNNSFSKDDVYVSIEDQINNSNFQLLINTDFQFVSDVDLRKYQLLMFCFKYWMLPNSAFLIPNTHKFRALRYSENLGLDNNYEYFTKLILQSDKIQLIRGPKIKYGVNINSLSRTYNSKSIISLITARITAASMVINYFGDQGKRLSGFLLVQTAFNAKLNWSHKMYIYNSLRILGITDSFLGFFASRKMNFAFNIFGLKILIIIFHIRR